MIDLIYYWRRFRKKCYRCGKNPPRYQPGSSCQACFDRMVEEFKAIRTRPAR